MESSKPRLPMKLIGIKTQGTTLFRSACKEADALFTLLNRQTLKTNELHYLHIMGYEIEYEKDLHPLYDAVGKQNVIGNKIKPEYFEGKSSNEKS